MSSKEFIEQLTEMAPRVPDQTEVLALRRLSVDEVHARTRRFLSMTADATGRTGEEGDWVVGPDHTLVRLPNGGHAVAYHASGSMTVRAGLEPMSNLFTEPRELENLTGHVEEVAKRVELDMWTGRDERLEFEKLWQIKASATDPRSATVDAVTLRAVGAYRHFVGDVPVWGQASAVVKVAAGGQLDQLEMHVRPTSGDIVDRVAVLPPDQAARAVLEQLSGLVTGSELDFTDIARPVAFLFGYFSHGKRKSQRYLAPAYVAMVRTEGEESLNHLAVVSATEKRYGAFARIGADPAPSAAVREPVRVAIPA